MTSAHINEQISCIVSSLSPLHTVAKMSRQLSVKSFFQRPNSVKKGEKSAVEDEGQIDNIYQSPTAVTGQPSGSKEVRREYRVQWEQEFMWLRREGGKMF